MKKNILGIVAVVIAVIVIMFVARGDKANENATSEITVGAILPMTGDLGFVGQEMERGMQIALDDYTDLGIRLIVEDNKSMDITTSVNALSKLVKIDNSVAVLNVAVNTQKALDPILKDQKVPGVVLWDNNEAITGMSEYSYAIGFSTEGAGRDMARFAYDKLGVRTVGIISMVEEWSELTSSAFANEFVKLGGEVVIYEKTQVDESDFRTVIAKMKQKNPDAIYFPQYPLPTDIIIKQIRATEYKGKLLTGDGFSDVDIVNLGELTEGIYLTQLWLEDESFRSKYVAEYGSDTNPINLAFAGLGYDGIKLVAEVVKELNEEGEQVTAETIQSKLSSQSFAGVTGDTVIGTDRMADKYEKILKVENGTFKLIQN